MALKWGTNFAWPSIGGVRVHFKDENNDAIYTTWTTVPTDWDSGYAKACLFVDTDIATGTSALYENIGTNTSCSFTKISTSGGWVTGSLDNAYSIGREVGVDEWAVVRNDATAGALNTMEFTKSWAGTGNIIDVAVSTTFTWNVFDVDMNAGVGAKAIYLDGGNATRTADLIDVKHDGDGDVDVFNVTATNTGSWAIFDINMWGTATGEVINIDMNAAVWAKAIYIDNGAGTRTADLIDIKHDGDGNTDVLNITASNTWTWAIFDISMDGNGSGAWVLNVDMNAAVGAEYLNLDAGAWTRTANLFEIKNDWDWNVDAFAITDSNTGSGSVFDINMDWIGTGSVMDVDMNAAVGEEFLSLDAGWGTRTANLFEIVNDGDWNVDVFSIVSSNTWTGAIFDLNMDGIDTGEVFNVDMNAAVWAEFIKLDAGWGTRTVALIDVTFDGDGNVWYLDLDCTNTGSWDLIDIDITGIHTGNAIDVTYGTAASTGDAIAITMDTNVNGSALNITASWARWDDIVKIATDDTGTWMIFDIDINGASSGNVIDVALATTSTGAVIAADMDAWVWAAFMTIDAWAGTRTVDLIDVTFDGDGNVGIFDINVTNTGSGNLIDIDIDWIHTGNCLDITYSTAASTGDAISVVMDTNVWGSALVLTWTWARTDDLIKIDDDSTSGASCIDINLSGAFTTAYAIDLTASGTHTSWLMNLTSDSANIWARNLVNIANDNTAAVGTIPLNIQQDAVVDTNFKQVITAWGFTIFVSDGTTAEWALTGAEWDLCLNWGTGAGQLAFCDAAGTNRTDM